MNDPHSDSSKRVEYLERILQNIGNELDQVAAEAFRGAFFSYPGEYRSKELAARHKELTAKADRVLDKISAIRRATLEAEKPARPHEKPDRISN